LNKKGVFFEVIMLVGFFYLLLTAIRVSLSVDSQTGVLTQKSNEIINLEKNLDMYSLRITSAVENFVKKSLNNYLVESLEHNCQSYKGINVINSDCFLDVEDYKNKIEIELDSYCLNLFEMSCEILFNDNQVLIKGQKEELFEGLNFNFNLEHSFYSEELEIMSFQNEVFDFYSDCDSKECIIENEFVSNKFEINLIENFKYEFFYEFLEEFQKCIRAYDDDCKCLNFNYNKIPENFKIGFEKLDEGVLVILFDNDVVVREEFLFGHKLNNIKSELQDYNLNNLFVKNDGFYDTALRLGLDLVITNKNLYFTNDIQNSCNTNISIETRFDILKYFSQFGGYNLNRENGFRILLNVTNQNEYNLDRNVFYYRRNPMNQNSVSFENYFNLGVWNDNVPLREQNLSFLNITSNFKIDENEIFLSKFLNSLKKSFPIYYYDNLVSFELEYDDKKYNFSFQLFDRDAPLKISNFEIYKIPFKKDNYVLRLQKPENDVDFVGFYFGESLSDFELVELENDVFEVENFNIENIFFNNQGELILDDSLLYDKFVKIINKEQAQRDALNSGEINYIYEYYFVLEIPEDKLFLSSFDNYLNENTSYSELELNKEFNLIPNGTNCDTNTFNTALKTISCEVPQKTIFGNEIENLIQKNYWGCFSSKTDLLENFDSLTQEFPNLNVFNSCTQNLYFLSFYDKEDNLFNLINDNSFDEEMLEFLNFKVYKVNKEIQETTEKLVLEII